MDEMKDRATTTERFEAITDSGGWGEIIRGDLAGALDFSADSTAFDSYWIVAGHHIREQVADDRLLVRFLRRALRPYSGGPVTLYRGENAERWKQRSIGLAWTAKIETGRMFGRGLNAVKTGGVLLRGVFIPSMIISGPNQHSIYLDEHQYTVDPFALPAIDTLEQYTSW